MDLLKTIVFITIIAYYGKGEGLRCYECNNWAVSGNYKGDPDAESRVQYILDGNHVDCDKAGPRIRNISCQSSGPGVGSTCSIAKDVETNMYVNGRTITLKGISRGCMPVQTYMFGNISHDCSSTAHLIYRHTTAIMTSGNMLMENKGTVCFCNTDLCNHGNGLAPAGFLFLMMALLITFF